MNDQRRLTDEWLRRHGAKSVPVVPRHIRRIRELTTSRDREFFEAHPDERWRVRPWVPGELAPSNPQPTPAWCVVIRASWGRYRFPLPGGARDESLGDAIERVRTWAERFLARLDSGEIVVPSQSEIVIWNRPTNQRSN